MKGLSFTWRLFILFFVFVGALFVFSLTSNVQAGVNDNLSGWAWSSNIGWISFNNTNSGGGQPFGVKVDATGNISGFAWSSNIGWISFNNGCPANASVIEPNNPDCSAKFNKVTGVVSGWARACAGTVAGNCTGASRSDGWDGWISLRGANHGIQAQGCSWTGWAWGSSVVGWISFDSSNESGATATYGVKGTDGNSCVQVPGAPQCSDGIDNADPEDILADQGDPGCYDTGVYDPLDNDETDTLPECSNFFDDDGDGDKDYPDDAGCTSSEDPSEDPPGGGGGECSDGIDNDGDGFIDFPADPQCSGPGGSENPPGGGGNPQCSDTMDNDNDGLTDALDPGCWTDPFDSSTYDPNDNNEIRIIIREVIPE